MRHLCQQDHIVAEIETLGMMSNEDHDCFVFCSGYQVRCIKCRMEIVDANNSHAKRLTKPKMEGLLNFHWEHQWCVLCQFFLKIDLRLVRVLVRTQKKSRSSHN